MPDWPSYTSAKACTCFVQAMTWQVPYMCCCYVTICSERHKLGVPWSLLDAIDTPSRHRFCEQLCLAMSDECLLQGVPEAAQEILECWSALMATWRHADQGRGLNMSAPAPIRAPGPSSDVLLTVNIRDCCVELVDNMPAGVLWTHEAQLSMFYGLCQSCYMTASPHEAWHVVLPSSQDNCG